MQETSFHPQKQSDDASLLMDELLAELPAGSDVLDIGCGGGSFPYHLYDLRIVAYDQHPPPQAAAFPEHVTFKLGVIEELPFAADSFDLVIANFVYEHVGDVQRCIEQAERVVRPGGLFYVSIPRAASLEDRVYRRLFQGQGGHVQRHSFESFMRQVYGASSFKLLAFADWPAGYTYLRSKPGLRAWVYRGIRLLRRLTGRNLLERNNFLLLFRRESRRGWRQITHCCSHCGGGAVLPASFSGKRWTCPHCRRRNPYVKP